MEESFEMEKARMKGLRMEVAKRRPQRGNFPLKVMVPLGKGVKMRREVGTVEVMGKMVVMALKWARKGVMGMMVVMALKWARARKGVMGSLKQ